MTQSSLSTDQASSSGTPLTTAVDYGAIGLLETTGQTVTLVACWVGIGVAAAALLGRRGHEFRSYAALGAVLGPVFVFLAFDVMRRRESERPIRLSFSSASSSGPSVLVVAVGRIRNTSATVGTMRSLGDTGEVYAAVPTTYEVGERVHRQGDSPPESEDLDDLAFLLASYGPGLMMLPGRLERSVPAAVEETGAATVVLVGEESAAAARELEETLTAKVVRVDGTAR